MLTRQVVQGQFLNNAEAYNKVQTDLQLYSSLLGASITPLGAAPLIQV